VTVLSNARSLGRIADLMSRGSLLSVETQKLSHSEPTTKYDHGLCFEVSDISLFILCLYLFSFRRHSIKEVGVNSMGKNGMKIVMALLAGVV